MIRIPPLRPETLRPDQTELYSSIVHGPRAKGPQHFALTHPDGSLAGPFNGFLLSPPLGHALQELGAAVRYSTTLTPRIREMAILIVAAHWSSAFETMAHESVGRAVGLTEPELSAIREGGIPALDDPLEHACTHLVHTMARGDVDDADWAAWGQVTGEATAFELSTLVGYYATLALQLRVFRVE